MEVLTERADPTERSLRFPPPSLLLVVGLLALLVVVALGVKLQSVRGPVNVDREAAAHIITGRSARGQAVKDAYRDIVDLDARGPVTVALVALAAWAIKRRDAAGLIVVVMGPLTAVFMAEVVLKPLVERRAIDGALSYPSGHVTAGASIAAALLLMVFRYAGLRWALVWSPVALIASVALAVSVVAIGWHYATDSVGGIALAVGVLCVFAATADLATAPNRASPLRG